MSDSHYGHTPQGPDGDDVLDVTALLPADALAALEREARDQVRMTPGGIADMSAGSLRMPAADVVVVEQLDDGPGRALRPLIPATFLDPAAWRHRRDVAANAAAFHGLRSPLYLGRALRVAGIGLVAGVRDTWSYLLATEYGDMSDQVRRTKAGPEHIADLRAERRKIGKARRREPLVVWSAAGISTYVAAVAAIGAAWSAVLGGAAFLPILLALYLLGRRELRRRDVTYGIVDRPVDHGRALLGADSINAAFRKAGLIKDSDEIKLVGPVRGVGNGAAEVVLDLPGSLTLSAVVKDRERLAAALRIQPEWLDLTGAGHPGRIRLWMTDSDPFATAQPSPLLAHPGRTDVWSDGIPIGFNRRGDVVRLRLRHVMALLGGSSRTGKGMILRNLICGLALEPRVNLRLVAGAKPGEHRGYAPVCATFFGRRPERLVVLLDAVLAEAYRREEYLEDQGRAKLSEGDLDRFPLEIVIIDEYKQYVAYSGRMADPGDPDGKRTVKVADRIADQIAELAAFAAALNITLLISTQDPDANTIPRGFKTNSTARLCTRTTDPDQTNAILKKGATGAGLRAHDIPETLAGAAIVDFNGAPGEFVRGYFIEDEKHDGAAPLITAGAELRAELGRLPGQHDDPVEAYLLDVTGESSVAGGPTGSGRPGAPAGSPAAAGPVGVLADLVAVFAAEGDPERMRTVEILAALAELDPDVWSAEALGVDPDDQAAYVRTGGAELRSAIDAALDGTGRELVAGKWTSGGGGRGYYLTDIRAAAGIDPV